MSEIKMEIPSDYTFVPGVRACIAHIAYNFGFDDREAYHVETVVDEICNNAIEYDAKGKDPKIFITCRFSMGEMELIVKDSGGRKFNVEEVFQHNIKLLHDEASKDENKQLLRGRGLIIVQKLVDKLDIETDGEGTTVKIIKKATKNKIREGKR